MALHAKQLVWRCRRGVRELDVIFGRFLEHNYGQKSDAEKAAFERLLEVQDPIIMDWLFGRSTSDDPEVAKLMAELRESSGL